MKAVTLVLMDEDGRGLFQRLLPRAISAEWDSSVPFAQKGKLGFESAAALMDALNDALLPSTMAEAVEQVSRFLAPTISDQNPLPENSDFSGIGSK